MILIAKTFAGIEDILCNELEAIGATNIRKLTRAVEFEGDLSILYKANLLCRTALRILKPICTFEAANEEMLYREIQNIDWSQHFSLEQTFAINTTLNQSTARVSFRMLVAPIASNSLQRISSILPPHSFYL